MVSQSLSIKIRGLYTFPNDFSSIPEGALSLADNVVIDRDSIAEPRRGFTYLADNTGLSDFPSHTQFARNLFFFQDSMIAHVENSTGIQSLVYYDPATGWTLNAALYEQPATTVKVRGTTMNSNLYLTGDLGVHRLDDIDSLPVRVGIPEAKDIDEKTSGTSAATPTWLVNTYSVAYQVCWGYKDENGNLFLGAPSGRFVYTNAAGSTKSMAIVIPIPVGVTTSYFVQVYRSPQVVGTPSTELRQVYEGYPSSANITAGSMTIFDIRTEALLNGPALYTNISQQGAESANLLPPKALDIAVFRESMFYANTVDLESFELTMLGIGFATDSSDTFTVGDLILQVMYADDYDYPYFSFDDEIGTDAQNIAAAAKSLVWAINYFSSVVDRTVATGTGGGFDESTDQITYTGHGYYTSLKVMLSITGGSLPTGLTAGAYYIIRVNDNVFKLASSRANAIAGTAINFSTKGSDSQSAIFEVTIGFNATYQSGNDDLPGKIRIRASSYAIDKYAVTSSKPTLFFPAIPTAGAIQYSNNYYAPNGLAYSKTSEPESFPLSNRMPVGSADYEILRIIPLRDSLFVLKEDGVYRLYGTDPSNFQVALLDSTANCIAPDTAVVMNNQIFALTTQGVVTISETGVTIMSRPIEGDLLNLLSVNKTILQQRAFAVSYESQRAYYLFVPTLAADTYPTQYYRYNTITNNWTRGTLAKTCGGVNPYDDLMYLGDPTHYWLDKERKNHTSFDYADYVSTETISGVSTKRVTITNASSLVVGQVIYQTDALWGEIAALVDATHVDMKYAVAFTSATAQILDPISVNMKWVPATFSNPGINKQVRETSILFLSDFYGEATVSFASDIQPYTTYENALGSMAAPWGLFPWGEAPFGVSAPRRRPLRVGVPRNHQRCSFLTVGFQHEVCFSPWAIQGISLIGNNISERVWMEGNTVE